MNVSWNFNKREYARLLSLSVSLWAPEKVSACLCGGVLERDDVEDYSALRVCTSPSCSTVI